MVTAIINFVILFLAFVALMCIGSAISKINKLLKQQLVYLQEQDTYLKLLVKHCEWFAKQQEVQESRK